jgi:hypothetical protein
MAGLDPAIHVLVLRQGNTWMPATSVGMTGKLTTLGLSRRTDGMMMHEKANG